MPTNQEYPASLRTPRLLLRRWQAGDAESLLEAIEGSRLALSEWTPWVIPEPLTVAAVRDRLAVFAEQFERGSALVYGIFDAEQGRVLGQVGIYDRVAADARELGYWLRSDATGHGFATEAGAALVSAAFELAGIRRIEAHCETGNVTSSAVARRLGFRLREVIEQQSRRGTAGPERVEVWVLERAGGESLTEMKAEA